MIRGSDFETAQTRGNPEENKVVEVLKIEVLNISNFRVTFLPLPALRIPTGPPTDLWRSQAANLAEVDPKSAGTGRHRSPNDASSALAHSRID